MKDMSVVERYNTGGHDLEWNGQIGILLFKEDEGLIRCKKCRYAWSFREKGNLKVSKCAGNSKKADFEDEKTLAGLEKWMKDNPNRHVLEWFQNERRFKCKKCGVWGVRGFGMRFEEAMAKPCFDEEGGDTSSNAFLKEKKGVG